MPDHVPPAAFGAVAVTVNDGLAPPSVDGCKVKLPSAAIGKEPSCPPPPLPPFAHWKKCDSLTVSTPASSSMLTASPKVCGGGKGNIGPASGSGPSTSQFPVNGPGACGE